MVCRDYTDMVVPGRVGCVSMLKHNNKQEIDGNPLFQHSIIIFSIIVSNQHVQNNIFVHFSCLISRANAWLHGNPDVHVVSCETVLVEGVYSLGGEDGGGSHSSFTDIFEDRKYQAFLTVFRCSLYEGADGGGGSQSYF